MPMLYFAYGSNLMVTRLRTRVPSARPLGGARLAGFAWRCDKRGADGTAKANLAPDRDAATWGALYEIEQSELPALDRAEGGYERVRVEVSRDGEPVEAITYVSSRVADDWSPAPWYAALIVAGAREHGLPADWIAMLERWSAEAIAPAPTAPAAEPGSGTLVFDDPDNHCFGCSPHNPRGLGLVLSKRAPGVVETRYVAAADLCGRDGVVHGGVQAAILDEAMGFAIHAALEDGPDTDVATVELSVRYRRPTPTREPLVVRAELLRVDERDLWVRGEIRDTGGRLCTEAESRWRRLRA